MALKLEKYQKITQLLEPLFLYLVYFFIPRPIETANASILKANANIKTSNI